MKETMLIGIGLAALTLSACNQQQPAVNQTEAAFVALQDRIAIEDMITQFYAHLGSGSKDGIADSFTEDAVLDINGIILKGHEQIQGIYTHTGDGTKPVETTDALKMHMDYMHLTNLLIKVDGDMATARMFWTGVIADEANAIPRFEEMGREYDLLVKQDDKWKFKKRVIVADGGLPKSMNDTYLRHLNYDITKAD